MALYFSNWDQTTNVKMYNRYKERGVLDDFINLNMLKIQAERRSAERKKGEYAYYDHRCMERDLWLPADLVHPIIKSSRPSK